MTLQQDVLFCSRPYLCWSYNRKPEAEHTYQITHNVFSFQIQNYLKLFCFCAARCKNVLQNVKLPNIQPQEKKKSNIHDLKNVVFKKKAYLENYV